MKKLALLLLLIPFLSDAQIQYNNNFGAINYNQNNKGSLNIDKVLLIPNISKDSAEFIFSLFQTKPRVSGSGMITIDSGKLWFKDKGIWYSSSAGGGSSITDSAVFATRYRLDSTIKNYVSISRFNDSLAVIRNFSASNLDSVLRRGNSTSRYLDIRNGSDYTNYEYNGLNSSSSSGGITIRPDRIYSYNSNGSNFDYGSDNLNISIGGGIGQMYLNTSQARMSLGGNSFNMYNNAFQISMYDGVNNGSINYGGGGQLSINSKILNLNNDSVIVQSLQNGTTRMVTASPSGRLSSAPLPISNTYTNGFGLGMSGNSFYADTTKLATKTDIAGIGGTQGLNSVLTIDPQSDQEIVLFKAGPNDYNIIGPDYQEISNTASNSNKLRLTKNGVLFQSPLTGYSSQFEPNQIVLNSGSGYTLFKNLSISSGAEIGFYRTGVGADTNFVNDKIALIPTPNLSSYVLYSDTLSNIATKANLSSYYLASNPAGYTSNTGTVTGTGTTNYLSKWSSSTGLTNSIISDNGSLATITGSLDIDFPNAPTIRFGQNSIDPNYGAISLNNNLTDAGLTGFFGGGDPNLYFQSQGITHFRTDGANYRMSILQNGFVGIGTTTPTTNFEVAGNGRFNLLSLGRSSGNYDGYTYNAAFTNASSTHTYIASDYAAWQTFGPSGGVVLKGAIPGSSGNVIPWQDVMTSNINYTQFFIGGVPAVTIESGASYFMNGNFGIGTTTPSSKLDVTGTIKTSGDVEITDATKGIIMTTPDGTKRYRYTIDNSGNFVKSLLP